MDEIKKIIDFFRNKNDNEDESEKRKHSLIMLAIYGVFLLVAIVAIRTGSNTSESNKTTNNQENDSEVEIKKETTKTEQEKKSTKAENDVNYSYVYTVILDGETEIYIGKKIDDKEKFSYTKNSETKEYAIKDDNYFILENDTYHLIDKPDISFKYCDIEKILGLVENISPVSSEDLTFYVDNANLAYTFSTTILENNNQNNIIKINATDDTIINVEMNLNSYISSILTGNHTLNIKMEYANVGKVEDFTIKLQ